MKLIELGSDQASFRTIKFNPNGLNIILGKHEDKKDKSTYNGVGKSLSLHLMHFCLGAQSNAKLKEKLPNWTFYLKFSIADKQYVSKRNTSKQSVIILNDVEKKVSEFNDILLNLMFTPQSEVSKISFRSLISRFSRSRREEYLNYSTFVKKEPEERALLSNSMLLGLKYDIVEKKFLLKEEYNKITDLKKNISSDEIFKSIYGDAAESEIQIKELEDSVSSLKKNLANFEIADDYKSVEAQASTLSYQLKSELNELALYQETLKNVIKSLEIPVDMNPKDLFSLLENVETELGLVMKNRIDDVLSFHSNLTQGRVQRLTLEKIDLNRKIHVQNLQIETTKEKYNNALKYLNSFGALEDYLSINQKLVDQSEALNKLKSSIELIERYKKRIQEIKVVLAEDNLTTEEYLHQEKEGILKLLMDTYRNLTGQFYSDKKGGISIQNNEGDNKLRYNLDVRIQDDTSDGINEVRIFCFDVMILTLQKNHCVKFLFHDSRLFSNMDSHQRFTALSIAHSLKESGFQYIMSMNQDTYDLLEKERDSDEFKEIIKDNIILELSGDTPENRLLGEHLDLNYE
jgi:uncharacterized protein YydD (DUF2326 family)